MVTVQEARRVKRDLTKTICGLISFIVSGFIVLFTFIYADRSTPYYEGLLIFGFVMLAANLISFCFVGLDITKRIHPLFMPRESNEPQPDQGLQLAPQPELPAGPQPHPLPTAPQPESELPAVPQPHPLPTAPQPESELPAGPQPHPLPTAPQPESELPAGPQPHPLTAAPQPQL